MATKPTDTNQASTMMESKGSSRMTVSRVTMVLALFTIVGVAVCLLNLAALHFLRPDVNPVLEPMSNYAVGPYGFLFTAADIGLGLAALALTFGLYLSIAPSGRDPTSGTFSLLSTASPYCWQESSRSMSAEKLRRSASSIILSATYRSLASLSP
jgi:hypothetical protein